MQTTPNRHAAENGENTAAQCTECRNVNHCFAWLRKKKKNSNNDPFTEPAIPMRDCYPLPRSASLPPDVSPGTVSPGALVSISSKNRAEVKRNNYVHKNPELPHCLPLPCPASGYDIVVLPAGKKYPKTGIQEIYGRKSLRIDVHTNSPPLFLDTSCLLLYFRSVCTLHARHRPGRLASAGWSVGRNSGWLRCSVLSFFFFLPVIRRRKHKVS